MAKEQEEQDTDSDDTDSGDWRQKQQDDKKWARNSLTFFRRCCEVRTLESGQPRGASGQAGGGAEGQEEDARASAQ